MLAFVLPIAGAVQCSERPGPPNLVLVVLDDLDVAMGSLGAMASARRLAAAGTSFTHYFASTPVCCPSRATMLLGQFAHNHGVMTAAPPLGGFPRVFASNLEADALPVALQEAGYRTALLGKYFIGYPGDAGEGYVPPGWDDWLSPLWGFTYFGYTLSDNGRTVYRGHARADYSTDVLAERALAFVRAAERDDRPFFLLLAPLAPHRPIVPAPRHRSTFPNARLPRVPSFDERDVSDKPAYLRALPRLSRSEIEAYDGMYRGRLQTLPAVDDLVRRLLDTLARLDLAGRTFVFLTSDNGFHLGHHRLR
ncbi:MAG TPA: sulfatase, partial [Thermoanaerobaculia bacterium]